jgi:hypothetical protein
MGAPARAQAPVVVFHPLAEVQTQPQDAQPSVIGARVARAADFSALFVSRAGTKTCTSTLIGPRVMLTAAHCVADGGRLEITANGQARVSTCTHAPAYKADVTADWALCEFDADVPGPLYERLNTKGDRISTGTELLLSGFGCTLSGEDDGRLRIGETWVIDVPGPGTNNHIVTRRGAAVCFRDSGGPAFLFLDAEKTRRVQVSVNSQGNISDTSYLSSLSTDAALAFLKAWTGASAQRRVCGLDTTVVGCHP